jgi:Holliday junction resolvasome RuvABC endonuclease subunit
MILGIDPGWKCGWAVVTPRTTRLVALGVFTSDPDRAIAKSTDRARRIAALGDQISDVARLHGCTAIAAEQMLVYGPTNAVVPQVLVWGMLTRLAAELGAELVEVVAKHWQHAVTPGTRKIAYAQVRARLLELAETQIIRVPAALRSHALDAVGVGVYAALRLPRSTIVDPPRHEAAEHRNEVTP